MPFLRNSIDFSFDSNCCSRPRTSDSGSSTSRPGRGYFDDASSITVWPATVYGVKTLWAALRLVLHRAGIVRSKKFKP